jgi:hypothetical protein
LRIQDESLSVVRKALQNPATFQPQYLPLSIDLRARAAFFDYYVTSKCWNFLEPYHHPLDSPEHLTLAIEAVSLAYLWYQAHEASSDAAPTAARRKYISAMRMLNNVLECPKKAIQKSTLLTSLLLDLFEKITGSKSRTDEAWRSHMDGALALVQLRGLEQFRTHSELEILARLSGNYLSSCVANGSSVSESLSTIQAHINQNLDCGDPKLRLSDLMLEYANLSSDIRKGNVSGIELVREAMELDSKIRALTLELPLRWQCSTTYLEHKSDMYFDFHFDFYPVPRVCQARNLLRVIRILLNQSLVEHCSASLPDDKRLNLSATAHENIELLACEICASVPQYMDCDGAARKRLVAQGISHHHTHTHELDVYSLIFPLYVAARSGAVPDLRPWAIKQLHYMGSHFHIRNAEVAAQILERGTDVSPWEIYALLGSYAFHA